MTRRVLIDNGGRETATEEPAKTTSRSTEGTTEKLAGVDDGFTAEERAYFSSRGEEVQDGLLSQYGLERAAEGTADADAGTGEPDKAAGDGATAPGFTAEASGGVTAQPETPPAAAEHFTEEDLDGAVADAEGRIRDTKGRLVPLAALVQSRARFKEARDRSTELERQRDEQRDKASKAEASLSAMREVWDERVRQLEAARTAQTGGQTAGAAQTEETSTEPPDPEEDIFGYVRWQGDRIRDLTKAVEEASKGAKEVGERTAAQLTERDMVAGYRASALTLAQREPNFAPAYVHLVNGRHKELEFHGIGDANERAKIISAEEHQLIQQAYSSGKDPAAYVYELAQLRGFVPQVPTAQPQPNGASTAPAGSNGTRAPQGAAQAGAGVPGGGLPTPTGPSEAERLASQARAQAATPTLSNSGSSSDAGVLTPESVANMSDAEFEALYSRNKAKVDALMGRG